MNFNHQVSLSLDTSLDNVLSSYENKTEQQNFLKHVSKEDVVSHLSVSVEKFFNEYGNICSSQFKVSATQQILDEITLIGSLACRHIDSLNQTEPTNLYSDTFWRDEMVYHLLLKQLHFVENNGEPDITISAELRDFGYEGDNNTVTLKQQAETLQDRRFIQLCGFDYADKRNHLNRLNSYVKLLQQYNKIITPLNVSNSNVDKRLLDEYVETCGMLPGSWIKTLNSERYRFLYDNKRNTESSYNHRSRVATINKPPLSSTVGMLGHEITHIVEDAHPQLKQISQLYLHNRKLDNSYLVDCNNQRYVNGGFVNPYVGKTYPHNLSCEVLSCGVEAVLGGSYGGLVGAGIWRSDNNHRWFTVGTLLLS